MDKALKYILGRQRQIDGKSIINIFASDDKKKKESKYNTFFNLNDTKDNKVFSETDVYNFCPFGVFMSLNPLDSDRRKKDNVKKILFIFVDLDHADKNDFEGVKTYLEGKGFKICYTAKTGGGYHILLDVILDKEQEKKVKGFLNYLHTHVSTKVDTCTGDLTRLLRVPGSEHHKKETVSLQTLLLSESTDEEIKNNGELILDFQLEESKNEINTQYLNQIDKEDLFFKEVLSEDFEKRKSNIEILNNATGRNPVFVKNLGIAINKNQIEYKKAAEFLNAWEHSRVAALQGWIKKAKEQNLKVNYPELLKWAKENNIKSFQNILKEQMKTNALDEYEIYYLEEEKKETCYLLYYPKKNYYVQKGLPELLTNIYYDFKTPVIYLNLV